jgi:phage/plasmid-like protein (TIGR03299 family)
MAHNIARIDGQDAMFCVGNREAAWHHLGQRTGTVVTWAEAMKLAKLDWQVMLKDSYSRNPITQVVTKDEGSCAVWRYSDTEQRQIGNVGPDFQLIQNEQQFQFVDALLQAANGAHYETAGALGNGETVWCLARIPGADWTITGTKDQHKTYLLVANGHVGNMAYVYKLVDERVVCENTFHVAMGENGAVGRIRHTKSAAARLDQARVVMPSLVVNAQALGEKMNALAQRRVTKASMVAILDKLFPENKDTENQGRRLSTLTKVLELFDHNDDNAIPEIRGTAYSLLNAITEFTDHFRSARITEGKKAQGQTVVQARAEGALFGTGATLKSSALAVIDECTKDAPVQTLGHVLGKTPEAGFNDKDFLQQLGIKS